jgi:Dinucleotide-utilizing enzymes involved in molybdopterin and thiamine biosynthesis family 1
MIKYVHPPAIAGFIGADPLLDIFLCEEVFMFKRLELIIGNDHLENIKSKVVLVIGIGGVGGAAVEALVRSGIHNIILVDFDVVEESNLNRQRIAFKSTIGMKKVIAMKNIIMDINECCNAEVNELLVDENNINSLFDKRIDYVIDACDDVKAKKAIINECLKRKIKFISSMGTGNKLDPSLLEIVDIRKTSNDPLARIFRKWVKDSRIKEKIMVLSSREIPVKTGNVVGSTSFVPNSAGLLIASYVIRDIIKLN